MGQAGAVAAQGQEVWAATHLEQTPVDRRDPLADTDGRAMAGRAGPLWALADGVRAVPTLAARRHLETILTGLQAQADAKGVITWQVNVDTTVVRAHQHAAGARKGGSGSAKNRAGSTSSRSITRSAAPGAG
jgi:hypothetical protein